MSDVTINDVAKLAKVSKATVSRVVSNSCVVTEHTREKVLKAIKELNYIPNSAAQNLTRSSSRIFGIVLNTNDLNPLLNSFFSEILNDISTYLIENNYYSLYIHCENSEKEKEYIDFLIKSRRIDGLIFLRAYEDESIFNYLDEMSFPFVIIGRPNNENKFLWVDNDNMLTSYNITKQLIDKGKTKFCFIGGSKKINVTKNRYKGFKKALDESNLEFDPKLFIEAKFDEMDAILKLSKKIPKYDIDAIVTTDDIFAMSACKILEKLDRKDILVTGYNNSHLRRIAKRTFTTVDINIKEIGIASCKLLLERVNKKENKNNHIIIETKIIGD